MKNITDFLLLVNKYDKKYMLILFVNVILSALTPFPHIILSKILFDMLQNTSNYERYLVIISILVLVNTVIQFLYERIDMRTEVRGQQLMFQLNCLFNQKTLEIEYEKLLQPSFLEKRELAKKVISGSNFIDLIRSIKTVIANVIIIIGIIMIVLQVGVYIIVPIILVIGINTYVNSKAKKVQYTNSVESVPYVRKIEYLQTVCSDFSYVKEVNINDCKDIIDKKYENLVQISFSYIRKIIEQQKKALQVGSVTNGIQDFLIYCILGYKTLVQKILTIGDFSMFVNAVNQFKTSVLNIMSALIDMRINSLNIGHFLEYMAIERKQSGSEQIDETLMKEFFVEFVDVSFQYPNTETYALRHVNCKLVSTDRILAVGENGAGKTTFVNLLLRLYHPTEGKILLNGIDIEMIRYEEYIKLFSSTFQDYRIFAFSLKENIMLGKDTKQDAIKEIIEQVGLNEKVAKLENGYDTIISKLYDENGTDFSGGEKQKVAIARALYKDSKIIVLDEPTSALDPLAEYEIYCQFGQLVKDRMSIFISHRLASNKFCNRILVFQDGKVIEDGTHKELIELHGLYQKMFERQSEFYIEKE